MASLIPNPKMQFLDANGNPLVGGKLYSYAAGTSTPIATYTDAGGGTPNANPVILNARGEASVWFGTAAYKLELQDSVGVVIWTVDNITGSESSTLTSLAASGGSSLVGFLQSGTGAVARTVQDKAREYVSVFDFMTSAQIADCLTGSPTIDAAAAIQAANDYAFTIYAGVFFPGKAYRTTVKLNCTTRWTGDGYTIINPIGDITCVELTNAYAGLDKLQILPDGTGGANNHGIVIKNAARGHLRRVIVSGCKGDGIRFDSTSGGNNNLFSFDNVGSRMNAGDGLKWLGGANDNGCTLTNVDLLGNTGNGLTATGICAGNIFNGVSAQNNTGYGMYFDGSTCRNNIGTAYVETNTAGDILFSSTAHTNMLWLSNNGSSIVDSNGTNTVLSAGSGSTQRYAFDKIDLKTARLYNGVNSGQLEFSHTGTRTFAITAAGSTSAFNTTFAKGSAVSHNCIVQGAVIADGLIYASNPTATGSAPSIQAGTGSPEGVVTARIGSIYQRIDGGALTSLYIKESGTGSTGWAAK